MRSKIAESLKRRMEVELSAHNPVRQLKEYDIENVINSLISATFLYTRKPKNPTKKFILFAEVISAIGHKVRNSEDRKKDSSLAAKMGAFLLYTLEELKVIELKMGASSNGHGTLVIDLLNPEVLTSLWETVPSSHTEKLPSEVPYSPFTTSKHETGVSIVKTTSKEILEELKIENQPIVFNVINKAQAVGWNIHNGVYELANWALRNKADAFLEIWEMQNAEAKSSKLRETKAIGDIAKRFLGKTFYHMYTLDFRGRKYPTSVYLNEQGCDYAKGLLRRADGKTLTEQGFFWLMISIANNWAGDAGRSDNAKTDKIPLNDRVYWALDNEEILLSYAENPKVNQGWMKADKPWQFISACFELLDFRLWQKSQMEIEEVTSIDDLINAYGYITHLEGYIDGSNNGTQHLSALTKDEVTAPLVNLVQSDLPGDLYKYVADHVWDSLTEISNNIDVNKKELCEKYIDELAAVKKAIFVEGVDPIVRAELLAKLVTLRADIDLVKTASPLYWLRITDAKHKRKICKRNTMTIAYGSSAYGMGSQQMEDARKHGIEQLNTIEAKWATYMGRAVYNDCKVSLKRPMQLLSVFEDAGKKAETELRYLKWTLPVTKFPAEQHYTQGAVKKLWIQYGPPVGPRLSTGRFENTYQVAIAYLECPEYSLRKQAQGASPNVIHSLDAAHLMLTVERAPFTVTTVHDSFGALLPDLPDLFIIVRETFVELYEANPLQSIMSEINGDISNVEIGNLDIKDILDSEYAFA